MIGETRRYVGKCRNGGYGDVQERRVAIGERNAAIPERHPAQVGKMVANVTCEADERAFDGCHLRDVLRMEKPQSDESVQGEEKNRAGLIARPD